VRTKREWRRWATALEPIPADVAAAVNAPLDSLLSSTGGLVLGYSGLPDEVPLTVPVHALPRLEDDGTMSLRRDDGRVVHDLGFEQPTEQGRPVSPSELTLVLVPGRVFDRAGYRLGRGGGHYDRLLPRLAPDALVVGVTCEARLVDRLPHETHDRPMTHLATEHGVFSTK
jgi:5-formyltetrahydrofolate cyclo-ligase